MGFLAAALPFLQAGATVLSAGAGLASALKAGKGAQKAPTMPTPDDDAVQAARRRQIAEAQARGGRASTILSDSDKLGG